MNPLLPIAPHPTVIPCHRPFAIAAWVLFSFSLFLPATENVLGWRYGAELILDPGLWLDALQGDSLDIHFLLLLLPNLFMLASPFLVTIQRASAHVFRWIKCCSAISVLLPTTFTLHVAAVHHFHDLRLGYFLWLFSFALLGLSFFRGAVSFRLRNNPRGSPNVYCDSEK